VPELPEVETIARLLREGTPDTPGLPGHRAKGISLLWKRSLEKPSEEELEQRLPGQILKAIDRRGKFLQLRFDQDVLLFHLRMSGDIIVERGNQSIDNHARFVIFFENNVQLQFVDTRKFGRIWLVKDPREVTGKLGPEPLDPALTTEAFYKKLNAHQKMLKTLLLDQTFIAGLGNIYVDESLNLAKLHPKQLSSRLSLEDAEMLLDAIRAVLDRAIQTHGSSIDWVYRGGDFQNYFRVYQRTGLPCPTCGTPVERIRLGQRGTHYCPNCQRL
jgi:formamidopyrimidine-DNA glycosylase